eukprot:CAMPEP_0183342268 /NCGR_PEP_ID=MMETSP0164_2-20130417/8400_1 /TAXON_ID=221442 /ORGANISM="Coccolithus pelagicus ssp braarudi, Strain PLY182g" /LENGTH=73 /DNA_ID=CAMNT_0025512797 /DNA_START=297 /DNA_END=518 /DNA_ORIENTATION=+
MALHLEAQSGTLLLNQCPTPFTTAFSEATKKPARPIAVTIHTLPAIERLANMLYFRMGMNTTAADTVASSAPH